MESRTYGEPQLLHKRFSYKCPNDSYLVSADRYYSDQGLLAFMSGKCSDGTRIGFDAPVSDRYKSVTHTQTSDVGFYGITDLKYVAGQIFGGLNFTPAEGSQAPAITYDDTKIALPDFSCGEGGRIAGFSGQMNDGSEKHISSLKLSCVSSIKPKTPVWMWIVLLTFLLVIVVAIIIVAVVSGSKKSKTPSSS